MRTVLLALIAAAGVSGGHLATAPANPAEPITPAAVPPAAPARLIAHEWGTFTSFSGSNGAAVSFLPNNEALPNFVYFQGNPLSKSGRLAVGGLISMETPVVYFYADRDTPVTVKVDFPKGWITEWYPFAHTAPGAGKLPTVGQSITWRATLAPGAPTTFPLDKRGNELHGKEYYHARATDATPLQVEFNGRTDDETASGLRGGTVLQREKFLFYRGVGTFSPPVTVRALGGDKVSVVNNSGGRATGLVLVTVRDGKLGFRPLADVEAGATADAQLPALTGTRAELGAYLVKALTAAGLYEKEATAMVQTWTDAWFGEEGTRLLYLVPRAKTDELLPIAIDPKPTELVRVLVGRHDFLTPEAEAIADRELQRLRAAQKEIDAANAALGKLGRFGPEAQQQAAKRLDGQK